VSDQFQDHLSRGGELLKADKVEEAQAALEAARALRPSDTKTLSLLGLVYFRTAEFDRARAIFVALVERQPADPSLRLNLGLVHLKLGEGDDAIKQLAEAVKLEPKQSRATGYLGLAYARAGRFAEARQAFLAAGQGELAREMEGQLEEAKDAAAAATDDEAVIEIGGEDSSGFDIISTSSSQVDPGPPSRMEPRPPVVPAQSAAADADADKNSMRKRTRRPTTLPLILKLASARALEAQPAPILEVCARSLVAAEDAAAGPLELGPGGVLVVRPRPRCMLRLRLTVAEAGRLSRAPAPRREKGRAIDRPFGSEGDEDRMMAVWGSPGVVVIAAPTGTRFTLLALDDDGLYVREELLVAFTDGLHWENGRVPQSGDDVPLVQLRGRGALALATRAVPLAVKLTASAPLSLPASRLVGWVGRVVPCLRDLGDGQARIECTGEGAVLVDPAADVLRA
jgi:thioredoxin-like negative regulator of GroEL